MARTQDLESRFLSKVEYAPDGCWDWLARCDKDGYAQFHIGSRTDGTRRTARAARVAYEMFVEPIPPGLQIDHLCRNRACVRPDHLEVVTPRENTLRGDSIQAVNAAKSHCQHGHEFTPKNTYLYRGMRTCRVCRRAYRASWRKK